MKKILREKDLVKNDKIITYFKAFIIKKNIKPNQFKGKQKTGKGCNEEKTTDL